MNYFRTHARVVSAFVMREISTRYGRSPGGYVWAFLEPMAFIALMTAVIGSLGHFPPIGDSFALFYATGYLAFHSFKGMESYLSSAISANKALMSYPIVAPIDAVVGRLVLQAATNIIVCLVVLTGAMYTTRHGVDLNWTPILEAVSLSWIAAMGISMANVVLFFHSSLYEKLYQIVSRPLFLISGVFFLPSMIPHPYREVVLWNPISHLIMLFRSGFYGDRATSGLDVPFLVSFVAISLMAGITAFTFFDVSRAREK